MVDYDLSNMRIIVGDLENALAINTIILITKGVIYTAIKKKQKLHMFKVRNDIKNFYFQEKYRHYTKGKKKVFDKQYMFLSNIHDKH